MVIGDTTNQMPAP